LGSNQQDEEDANSRPLNAKPIACPICVSNGMTTAYEWREEVGEVTPKLFTTGQKNRSTKISALLYEV
jgi:hypothetical protein